MIRDWRDALDDMVEYVEKAQAFVGTMNWLEFKADEKTRFATVRAIEIIGEAARRVPIDMRERYPDIPWQQMIGMRNVLAHDYVGTNPRVIFDTVTIFIPDLLARLRKVIATNG
ncbi:MAG: DUF86 domain-containing protein [Rhodospirillaceae bacterium]|nr:DUF86 domain-containing protein [Rhodospirillales bacterium]